MSSVSKWLSDAQWTACNFGEVKLEDLRGLPVWAGLDLASVRDVSCLVLLTMIDDKYVCLPYFWTPKELHSLEVEGTSRLYWLGKRGLMELT